MARIVSVRDGRLRYVQRISVGPHVLQADEPVIAGGNDSGPNPYELLLAALGSCANITVRMYAERKQWPLEGVQVQLAWAPIHANDCAGCDTEIGMKEGIEMEVFFTGNLSEEQQRRLVEIANKCPVHRTLGSEVPIRTHLLSLAS